MCSQLADLTNGGAWQHSEFSGAFFNVFAQELHLKARVSIYEYF